MDALSTTLQPYKGIIGSVASYLTIAQFFSGGFICNDIRKKGSTREITSIPFVGGVAVGLAMLKYALLLNDQVMLTVNVAAISLNILYCLFYFTYAEDKWDEILKPLAIASALVGVLWGYAEFENPSAIEFRYGLIVTVLMLLLLGNPLLGVKEIVQKKDASQIPFVLTLMGTLVTLSWLLYAIILRNSFMIVQNFIGFNLCLIQLILIFIYPGKPSDTKKKD